MILLADNLCIVCLKDKTSYFASKKAYSNDTAKKQNKKKPHNNEKKMSKLKNLMLQFF